MRDILDALESIHTNKKKPMDVKKELNKKPAVMKALSLEGTEVLEGTEMGQIGNVHIKQFGMAKGQLGIQLTSDKGEGYVQMSKEDAKAMAERLLQWANSSEPAMPGEYESKETVEEEQVEEDCACETELTTNSEEREMETTKKDTVEVAVEDLARVLELAGLGKEVIKAEAEAEAEATEEATTEAPNEVELDEYSNSPDEDYFDADTQLNKLSGGLNGPKKQLKKEYPGDNPLAVDLETKLAKMLSDM